jgi:hypothetical protein
VLSEIAPRFAADARLRHLLFLGCTLLTVAVLGYYFGTFDQFAHIPFLKRYADPTLYPDDTFIALRNENYSYFWWLFIPAYRAGVLEPVMFIAHLALTYLTFWIMWRLSELLFANPNAALLSTLALIVPHLGFGGFPIFEWSLLNRTFALPVALIALFLYLRDARVQALLVAGALMNFHVITVVFVAAMFAFDLVARALRPDVDESRKRIAVEAVAGWAGFLLMASPVLLWRLSSPAAAQPNNPEWFDVVVRGSLANLFQVISPVPHILFVTAGGLGTLLLLYIGWRYAPANSPKAQRVMAHFSLALTGLIGLQALTALVYPIDIVNQLQIIRAGGFLNVFSVVWFAHYLTAYRFPRRLELAGETGRRWLLAAYFMPLPIVPALVWVWQRWLQPRAARTVASLVTMLGLVGGALALVIPLGLWQPAFRPYGPQTDWEYIQRCARELTPRDALFITPPEKWGLYGSDWRTFSERSTLATHSELLMIALAPIHYDPWQERFVLLAPGAIERFNGNFFDAQRFTREAFNSLSDEQLLAVAARYDVDYLVLEQPRTLPLPSLNCVNRSYTIYVAP